jgi:hypothetical protein
MVYLIRFIFGWVIGIIILILMVITRLITWDWTGAIDPDEVIGEKNWKAMRLQNTD